MKFPIGFALPAKAHAAAESPATQTKSQVPVKSLVQIHFPTRNLTLSYYNDRYDLHPGDLVYVDGKLEGLQGQVTQVSRTFKIKLSDYHRVIGRADTAVRGAFALADSHLVCFDPKTLPYEKVRSWLLPPVEEEDEETYATGDDSTGFALDDLSQMHLQPEIAHRGHEYYMQNRAVYLCLEGTHGRAIVNGTQPYELEFEYSDGQVTALVCGCYCSFPCKHQLAAMLQLKETLAFVQERRNDQYESSGYFAAVSRSLFFDVAMSANPSGSITLDLG